MNEKLKQRMIASLRNLVKRNLREAEIWVFENRVTDESFGMWDMYVRDARDCVKLARLIEQERWVKAYNLAASFDTALRESLADFVWVFLQDKAVKKVYE